jgi:hypothetical protein
MARPAHNAEVPAASPLYTSIEISRDLLVALRPEAARRQTTVPRLINHLLAVTVEDKLTTAILDD